MKEHVIICGLGHIGFRSFELLNAAGFRVAVITDKTTDDWRKRVEECGGTVLMGDARSDQLLVQAGIKDAFAILAVTDHDLVNVSVVMDARRMNSKVRIVCRLFDTNLGKHISDSFGVSQVFSTSELAAPVFVEAISKTVTPPAQASSENRYLLVENPSVGLPIVTMTDQGEILSSKVQSQTSLHLAVRSAGSASKKDRTILRIKNSLFSPSLGKFRRVGAFIGAVIAVSALILKLAMSLSWIDAIYFVTTTVTTVGYGDFNFSNATPALKVFGILLMLVGASSLAILFSAVAEVFLSERLSSLFGGKPVPRKGHVVLVGGGHIGIRVAEHLIEDGMAVAVIENDKVGRFPVDTKRRVAVVEGDPRNANTLKHSNIETAEAVLSVSDDDVQNLSVALSAKTLNPQIQSVVRVFDADLGSKLQSKLGLHQVLSVSGNAAPYFVAAIMGNGVKAATRWRNHLVFLAEQITDPRVKVLGSHKEANEPQALSIGAVTLSASNL